MSRKRELDVNQEDKKDCYSLSKKIKNFHLNSTDLQTNQLNNEEFMNQPNLTDLISNNHLINQSFNETDELNQRLLTDQIVNYSNSIINNQYCPDTGAENNRNYLKINKILFDANKMRLLRNQVRLLNRSQ